MSSSTPSTPRPGRSGATTPQRPGTSAAAARTGLPPAAQRALAEAEERRKRANTLAGELPKEIGGRRGPEPTRYGDWEVRGLSTDF